MTNYKNLNLFAKKVKHHQKKKKKQRLAKVDDSRKIEKLLIQNNDPQESLINVLNIKILI